MAIDTEKLVQEIFQLMREETKDLWKEEDSAFLMNLAEDVTREKILALGVENPEEHKRNLLHLAATLRGEVARRGLRVRKDAQEIFVKVLQIIIKTIASAIFEAALKVKTAP